MLLPGKMYEQILSLDYQTDETNFDTEWKWNIVSEELEQKFGTFHGIKRTVDIGWPHGMNGIETAQQNAEPNAQER